jgi:2-keto-4-pentenoate hydratase
MITEQDRSDAASALARAARDRTPIAPLTESLSEFDLDDAYAVQRLVIAKRIDAGARRVGWKVGLTSAAMQRSSATTSPNGHREGFQNAVHATTGWYSWISPPSRSRRWI